MPATRGLKIHMEFKRLYEHLHDEAHVSFRDVFHETQGIPFTHNSDRPDSRVEVFGTRR